MVTFVPCITLSIINEKVDSYTQHSFLSYNYSVLWCPLRQSHQHNVWFVVTTSSLKERCSLICYVRLLAYCDAQHILTLWVALRISYKKQGVLTLHEQRFRCSSCCSSLLFFFILCCVFVFAYLDSVTRMPNAPFVSRLSILDCTFDVL